MKTKGFSIEIQDGLSEDDLKIAKDYANEFIAIVTTKGNWNHLTCGGFRDFDDKHWPLQRGVYGRSILASNYRLVFRRGCKNKRIFQIVEAKNLRLKDPKYEFKCPCIVHGGGQRVQNIYGDIKCSEFYRVGDIRG